MVKYTASIEKYTDLSKLYLVILLVVLSSYRKSLANNGILKFPMLIPKTVLPMQHAKIKSIKSKLEKIKFGGSIFLYGVNLRKSEFIYCPRQIKFSITGHM